MKPKKNIALYNIPAAKGATSYVTIAKVIFSLLLLSVKTSHFRAKCIIIKSIFKQLFPHPVVVSPGMKLIGGALPHFCNSFIVGE